MTRISSLAIVGVVASAAGLASCVTTPEPIYRNLCEAPDAAYPDPVPVYRVAPDYPRSEARDGNEGFAILEFALNTDGEVQGPLSVDATSPAFAEEAVEAVQKWRYAPQEVDGIPVEITCMRVTVEFERED